MVCKVALKPETLRMLFHNPILKWSFTGAFLFSITYQGETMFRKRKKVILNDICEISSEIICSLKNCFRFWVISEVSSHLLLGSKNVLVFRNKLLLIVILLTHRVFPYNYFQGQTVLVEIVRKYCVNEKWKLKLVVSFEFLFCVEPFSHLQL